MGKEGFIHPIQIEILTHKKAELEKWAEECYDELVEKWQWVAPEKLTSIVMPYLEINEAILDAGCGTGLCGEILTSQGYTVDGIDFSTKLLEYAKNRGYRELRSANLAQQTISEFIGKKYKSIITAGVYGEYLTVNPWLIRLCDVLEDDGVIAIAGHEEKLVNSFIFEHLRDNGMHAKKVDTGVGYYMEGNEPVDYLYIIAEKITKEKRKN